MHDRALASERADRHPAADHLAQRGEIGCDAVEALRAAHVHTEAGHHFIEDKDRAVAVAEVPQPLQESGPRCDQVHVARDRLDNHPGDLVGMRLESGGDFVEIVISEHQRLAGDRRRHARRRRLAEGERARARLDQQAVSVAVIAAFELHDLRPPRVTARESQRGHRRLGAGAHQPHQLERWEQTAQRLRDLDLAFSRRAERQSVKCGLLHSAHGIGMRVPEDRRAPRPDVVDVALAVRVPQVRAFATDEEARRAADRAKGAHGRIDAARDRSLRASE